MEKRQIYVWLCDNMGQIRYSLSQRLKNLRRLPEFKFSLVDSQSSFYLNDIFQITRKSNPNQKIILLGDDYNKKYQEKFNLEFHNINEYLVNNFNYKHYSVNTILYEKFCYERWIILNNFLKTTTYETIVYSDSDNAFYMDIDVLLNQQKFNNFDVLYLGNGSVVVPNIFVAKKNIYDVIVFDKFEKHPNEITFDCITKKYAGDFSDSFLMKSIFIKVSSKMFYYFNQDTQN